METFGGRFQILKEIYHQPPFSLYAALDRKRDSNVLIRLCEGVENLTDEERKSFIYDLEQTRQIKHFNIPEILEIVDEKDLVGVILAPITGESLYNILNSGRLFSINEVIDICVQIASALDYAHIRDIIHGLLTAHDIILDATNKVYVIGFGFSRLSSALFKDQKWSNTIISYFAPEVIREKKPAKSSDIFSLGAILYELLTGIEAFAADTIEATVQRILEEEPPPPRAIDTRIPSPFNLIVSTALNKNPLQRYTDCGSFIKALKDKNIQKELSLYSAIEEKGFKEIEEVAKKYDVDTKERDDEIARALKEWREDLPTQKKPPIKKKQRVAHVRSEDELPWESEEMLKRRLPFFKRQWLNFLKLVKPTPTKLFLFAFLLGGIIIYLAYYYYTHPLTFIKNEFKEKEEETRLIMEQQRERTKVLLFERAEQLFQKGQFVRPPGNNAYELYRDLQLRYPETELPQKRIDEMAKILKKKGWEAFYDGKFKESIQALEDYLVIVPEDEKVKQKLGEAQERLEAIKPQPTKTRKELLENLSGTIIYTSKRGGNSVIMAVELPALNKYSIPAGKGNNSSARFTASGNKMVFVSDRDGNMEIYSAKRNGDDQVRLTNNIYFDTNPTISPKGTYIAFASKRYVNWEIYLIKADGTDEQQLTKNQVWDDRPTFSPDERSIAYQSRRQGQWDIYRRNIDGSAETRLTQSESNELEPDWSPNDKWIAFTSDKDYNMEIYLMRIDGSDWRRMTRNFAKDCCPAWSFDGNFIAFISDDQDGSYIKIMDLQGRIISTVTGVSPEVDIIDWIP